MPDTPDDALRLSGASNFRDLAASPGTVGHGGRPLRRGQVFRSDHLAGLTEADRAAIAALGLGRALDFRGVAERAAAAYDLPGVTQHALSIEPTVVQHMQALVASGQALTVPTVTGLMHDLYRGLVNDQSHRFAELFAHLLDEADTRPLVFHCTAGKDRTGLAAALILLALGVPRDAVLHDYLLTNERYSFMPGEHPEIPRDALMVLWRVQQGFLDEALLAIDRDHGGLDRYLPQRLGLTPAALQALAARYLAEG
ncbi:tyrosine-protein phosphatase [Ideonella sp. DXS22W]|uniref:Tyrosine-protein phosphatase n=1 Tax=Pseudaquabacterium inlustre TaxID=2984192 RepID=A0ABU9CMQ5_9BURK